jgi:hypothetical protein
MNSTVIPAGVRQVKPRAKATPRLKVATAIKAGSRPDWPISTNHNEAAVRAGGLKVQSSVKAGGIIIQD